MSGSKTIPKPARRETAEYPVSDFQSEGLRLSKWPQEEAVTVADIQLQTPVIGHLIALLEGQQMTLK